MAKSDDLEIVIGADLSGLASDLSRAGAMARRLAQDVERHVPRARDFTPTVDTSGLMRASRAAREVSIAVRSAAVDLGGLALRGGAVAGGFVAVQAGLNGVAEAARHVRESVVMAADFEQNSIAFGAMLGSADRAVEVMGRLRKFAADTPFSSKEVTEGARQLLAYGVAVDDLIPSLRTIGTFAAVSNRPLSELVYNVGTTKVQGRATQLDINQLTGKGIDIYPGLAKELKVDQTQVRKATEDGRADWNAYKAALVDLGNTRYAGLLEKQADSLKGSWEQLTDAFDRAKLKLGQIIVQEVGLRGVGKELEGFAGRLERGIGSDRFREGVRFVGDLVKGGAQLAYEFGRAGAAVASLNLEGIARTNPDLGRLAGQVREIVAGLKDFKLDERAVTDLGLGLFEGIAYPIAGLTDYVKNQGNEFAKAFRENFKGPVEEFLEALREVPRTRDRIKEWIDRNEPFKMNGETEVDRLYAQRREAVSYLRDRRIAPVPVFSDPDSRLNIEGAGLVKAAQDLPYFNPPRSNESDAQVLHRFRHLQNQIAAGEKLVGLGFDQFKPFAESLKGQRAELLRPYSADPGRDFEQLRRSLDAGRVPARRADWVDPPLPPAERSNLQTIEDMVGSFRRLVGDRQLTRDIDRMRGGWSKLYEGIRKNESLAIDAVKQGGLAPALGGLGGLAPDLGSLKRGEGLYLPSNPGLSPHLADLARGLNEQYAGAGLDLKLADLKSLLDEKQISGDVFQKARDASIREVGERMGLGQPSRLPDAVLAGSQEDARLLAQAMGGGGPKTTDDLLREIRMLMERQSQKLDNIDHNTRGGGFDFGGAARAVAAGVMRGL